MTEKTFPLSHGALKAAAADFSTPFYLYDERAIRENARRINDAFSVFPGYINHFAVKAMPNPAMLRILREEGFGADCSSLPELLLAEMSGIDGEAIMFTSNDTPSAEYRKARELGAVINLDDFTHIEFLEKTAGLPEILSIRYNPGPLKLGNTIIGNPVEAKYGFTREQTLEGFALLKKRGVKRFALHTMVASNELKTSYHIETGIFLFELAVEIRQKTGISVEFVNLGGGVGIPYRTEDTAVDYRELAAGLKEAFDDIMVPAGLGKTGIHTEWGRAVTGPYGWLVTRAIHRKEIYRKYICVDASMADLMRPAIYGAYHHITVSGKEASPLTEIYDVAGSLCENFDKFAVQRPLPAIEADEESGDLLIVHDAGAHGRAMGFNYNGKLRCAEVLLRADGALALIRRRETTEDLFATLRF
ncbi:MAG: diaminopimelate decarboxylase [Spirochaetaceae bacterium]|jgi:diaminopimelate decarboxylase|nr:diaminopimelate decarboxylase [Spirochaetaceae bacterium]